MTKKDFEVFAEEFKKQKPEPNWPANHAIQFRDDCEAFCRAGVRISPRFDTGLFLKACGFNRCAVEHIKKTMEK